MFLSSLAASMARIRSRSWISSALRSPKALASARRRRIGAVLLDQLAFRRDHQRGALQRGLHPIAASHRHQEQGKEQEQQAEEKKIEDQPAGEIHHVPQADEKGGDGTATDNLIHG